MKPGEFVGADGRTYRWGNSAAGKVWLEVWYEDTEQWVTASIDRRDIAPAIATLQSLLPQPSVHPAVGLRYCGEEEFKFGVDGRVYEVLADGVLITGNELAGTAMQKVFDHGREYERRQG